jgi:transcription initiation factor TFIIA large subunit
MKYENGVGSFPPPTEFSAVTMKESAKQRSAEMLTQQFGSQANASIQAAGFHQQPRPMQMSVQQRPPHIQLPAQAQARPPHQQYPQQHGSISTAQTDGAGDGEEMQWFDIMAIRRSCSKPDRIEADHMLRGQLEGTIAMTDSGLMLPLDEQLRLTKKKRKLMTQRMTALSITESSPSVSTRDASVPQYDGGDDDDSEEEKRNKAKIRADEDEDAINSDLDDDDEEAAEVADSGDGPVGETILCTYDKVQRVKNKWKCTLKDGILTTGGKEYVFHKANGEFEW